MVSLVWNSSTALHVLGKVRLDQGSLEDLDRKAIQMSIFDIPKWAHSSKLENYYASCFVQARPPAYPPPSPGTPFIGAWRFPWPLRTACTWDPPPVQHRPSISLGRDGGPTWTLPGPSIPLGSAPPPPPYSRGGRDSSRGPDCRTPLRMHLDSFFFILVHQLFHRKMHRPKSSYSAYAPTY